MKAVQIGSKVQYKNNQGKLVGSKLTVIEINGEELITKAGGCKTLIYIPINRAHILN